MLRQLNANRCAADFPFARQGSVQVLLPNAYEQADVGSGLPDFPREKRPAPPGSAVNISVHRPLFLFGQAPQARRDVEGILFIDRTRHLERPEQSLPVEVPIARRAFPLARCTMNEHDVRLMKGSLDCVVQVGPGSVKARQDMGQPGTLAKPIPLLFFGGQRIGRHLGKGIQLYSVLGGITPQSRRLLRDLPSRSRKPPAVNRPPASGAILYLDGQFLCHEIRSYGGLERFLEKRDDVASQLALIAGFDFQ